jgi:lysophospholipase L1-like esterase
MALLTINHKKSYTFDLWEKIKYHDMPAAERDSIWDDGLHFTELGYEKMGSMVAERLGEILNAETKSTV